MSKAINETTFRRLQDAIGTRDPEVISKVIDEVTDPGLVFHAPKPGVVSGTEALKQVWMTLLRAFPDIEVTTEDVVAEGDKIVYRNRVTGTHQGEYRGLPPTGRSVDYAEIFVVRFAAGRIAEIWGVVDVFTQLKQLGVVDA